MKVSQYILTTTTGFDEQSQIVSVGRKRPMVLLGRCSALALVPFLCLLASVAFASTNLSVWVYPGSSGRLIHQPDAQDNHIVDSSGVGYMGGTVPLPNVPVVLTISPVSGDNQANIQNALDQIAVILSEFDYPIKDVGAATPRTFQRLIAFAANRPERLLINSLLLRALKRARYVDYLDSHFGLASDAYCHFTSPIRRYPDLMVHRLLKAQLAGTLDKGPTAAMVEELQELVARRPHA